MFALESAVRAVYPKQNPEASRGMKVEELGKLRSKHEAWAEGL